MEIAFCRIDDRLIHGQVATVWTRVTGCNRIMCCSDEVAADSMRKKLLLQVAPPGIKAYVVPVDKACEAYKNPKYAPNPLLVNMVTAGKLGVKSGEGFYDYAESKKAEKVSKMFLK